MQKERVKKNTLWLSFWGNFWMAVLKITVAMLGFSRLLLIDGIHSAANSIIAVTMVAGLDASQIPADEFHKYGHGKAEFIFSALSGLIVIVAGLTVFVVFTVNLNKGYIYPSRILGVVVTFISLVANLVLYHFILNKGKELNSRILKNNALNNYLNAITSSIVLIGITSAILSLYWMEQVAAVVLFIVIVCSGIRIFYQGINGIMDRSSFRQTPERLYEIKRLAASVKEVKNIEDIKIKRNGDKDLVDMEVVLRDDASLSEMQSISEKIKRKVLRSLNYVENIFVEFKPENS